MPRGVKKEINIFGNYFDSMSSAWDYYKDESWVSPSSYVDFARILREYNVDPTIALSYDEKEIKQELELIEDYKHLDYFYYNMGDPYEAIEFKDQLISIFDFFVYRIMNDSSDINIRNLNIFARRLFYKETLENIGNSHSISKERVRQICSKTMAQMRHFLWKNKVDLKGTLFDDLLEI